MNNLGDFSLYFLSPSRDNNKNSTFLFPSTGSGYYKIHLIPGKYKFELWGASSGLTHADYYPRTSTGKGGYTSGILNLDKPMNFGIFVGTQGENATSRIYKIGKGGYNGGCDGGRDSENNDAATAGSGGATDVRIIKDIKIEPKIIDRIMVAGAGGSNCPFWEDCYGGNGGGISGTPGIESPKTDPSRTRKSLPGNQTFGYKVFQGGKGEDANEAGGSGGGGYFGGFGGINCRRFGCIYGSTGGAGGSSYISGHPDCVAMDENFQPLPTSIHISNIFFHDPKTIVGNQTMPSPISVDEYEELGHLGDGFARITVLQLRNEITCVFLEYRAILYLRDSLFFILLETFS